MCIIIRGDQRDKHNDLFDRLFRLRHDIFIRERQWTIPSKNGFETDQYDTDDAVYFITFGDDGEIEGSVRMTPTLQSSLLADYFQHLIENGEEPRGANIYEATRYFVRPARNTRSALKAAKVRLLVPLFEWCLAQRLDQFQAVIDYSALSAFIELSPLTRVLGLAHPFAGGSSTPGGGQCIAVRWPVSEAVINDMKAFAGVTRRTDDIARERELAPLH